MDRATELENRKICRICLNQEDDANFSDIFDSPNLPMEILSIGSVEVFQSDGMPRKICECCKVILGNAYKFKQICKRSDTLLKMYPITGNVPARIEIPQEMLPARMEVVSEKPEMKSVGAGTENPRTNEMSTQTEPEAAKELSVQDIEQLEMVIQDETFEDEIIAPPVQFSETTPKRSQIFKQEPQTVESVKILNKSQAPSSPPKQFKKPAPMRIDRVEMVKPKILNSQLLNMKCEDTIVDSIEATPDGNIQIISYNEEYIDEEEKEDQMLEEARDKSDDLIDQNVIYSCDFCDRSFPLLQQLQIHRKNHTRERNHPCADCDKSFFSKYDLAKHVLTHTKQKDYTCIVCKKSFSRSTLLYRHEKIHTDPNLPRHECLACDRVYLNKLDYEKHILTHAKNRPFACKYCEKSFAFKQGLERHEVSHDSQNQPHPCQYCELRFPTPARLQRHLSREHAGTRPFPCTKCTKRFMLSHHLYRHMKTAHSNQNELTSFQCPECDEVVLDRVDFFVHCTEHAVENLSCPLCKNTIESPDEAHEHLLRHSKTDMYYCEYCNLIYMSQLDLDQHFLDQHSNELCSVGEDEVEFLQPSKRSRNDSSVKTPAKRSKNVAYELESTDGEQYEYLNTQTTMFIPDGAAFVEYEEFEVPAPTKPQKVKAAAVTNKTYSKASAKTVPEKSSPVKIERVKLSSARIEQLKKEGKIKIVNGEMVMKA